MKSYNIPQNIKAIIFDIDLTLYDNRDYYDSQERLLIERLARQLGLSFDQAKEKVSGLRSEFKRLHEGRSLSLGNSFLKFGVSIAQSVRWRDELFQPEEFLKPDKKLKETLRQLSSDYKIAAVTNNTTKIGIRTLTALGVIEYFPIVIGLDISAESKPTMRPFKMISEKLNIRFDEMLSVGDRYAVDLELPIKNGCGGVLVENMQDVYELPSILG